MGNLLFSPSGRIGSAEFMRGVILLIVISAVLTLLPMISPALSALGMLGLIMIWCWIVLYVKRFHDAGKSGWLTVAVIIAMIILSVVVNGIIGKMFAGDLGLEMEELVAAAAESGNFKAVMEVSKEMGGKMARKTAIPSAIAGAAISYGIAMAVDKMFPRDPSDNQYGPA